MAVLSQYHRRRKAWLALKELAKNERDVLLIHYSCETFTDEERKSSPRVTAITVRNFVSAQTACFSIAMNAELKKISFEDIEKSYNLLESILLKDFYEFVRNHPDARWVHWNMRDTNYGFPALAHRAKVLHLTPVDIHDHHLYDLSRILIGIYGVSYIGHPRLQTLMELNSISNKDFLTGAQEAQAFDEGEYQKLQMSTSRKVDSLENILERTMSRTLKNNSKWNERHGNILSLVLSVISEHKLVSVLGVLGSIASLIALFSRN